MVGLARSNDKRKQKRQEQSLPYARAEETRVEEKSIGKLHGMMNYFRGFFGRRTSDSSGHGKQTSPPPTSDSERDKREVCDMTDEDNSEVVHVSKLPSTSHAGSQEANRNVPRTPGPPNASHTTQQPHAGPSTSQLTPNNSPLKAHEEVAEFLLSKGREGTQLNKIEVEGIMSLLHKASEETITQETFRFTVTPSPSNSPQPESPTPFRRASTSNSRVFRSSLPTLKNNVSTPAESPKKVLTKNPNGEYRWTGGGSARASSRRGSPSKAAFAKTPANTEYKRRRVDEDEDHAMSDSPSITNPPTVPSMDGTNRAGTSGSGTGPSNFVPSRIPRASLRPKTAPVRPSPLRNVVTESPPGSPPSNNAKTMPSSQQRQGTRAAGVLTEIIEKATPPSRPDVSNPYQTASPVKPVRKEKRRVSGTQPKPSQNMGAAKAQAKEETLSQRAIIEATVPRGAKRSRPSINVNGNVSADGESFESDEGTEPSPKKRVVGEDGVKASAVSVNGQRKRSPSVIIEEVDDDVMATSRKSSRYPSVTIEEVDDVEMIAPSCTRPSEVIEPTDTPSPFPRPTPQSVFGAQATTSVNGVNGSAHGFGASQQQQASGSKASLFGPKSSAPKEPSKLRKTFVVGDDESENSDHAMSPFGSKTQTPTPNPFAPKPNGFVPTPPAQPSANTGSVFSPKVNGVTSTQSGKSAKETAMEIDVDKLPVYHFTFPTSTPVPEHASARSKALAIPESDLPKYDFSKLLASSSTPSPSFTSFAAPKTSTPTITQQSIPTPAPAPSSAPPKVFDWAAAGLRPKVPAAGDSWTCNTCMLSNPGSATEKCTVCDTPRYGDDSAKPTAAPAPAAEAPKPAEAPAPAPVKAFDWTAAGLKPKETQAGGSWTCSTCMLLNPASATEKCTVCETPR